MSVYSLKIKNYKTIKDSEIVFKGNLSGIYGPNGTGKTAILEILHIIKEYFTYAHKLQNDENNIDNLELKSMIQQGITKGQDTLAVELVLLTDETLYKLEVEFKIKDDNIIVLKEALSSKENVKRKVFKNIITVLNKEDEILPTMYLSNKSEDKSDLIDVQARKKAVVGFNNFFSYLSLLLKDYLIIKNEVKDDDLKVFYTEFEKVSRILRKSVIVTLRDQAFYNLGILIPMNVYLDNSQYGVIPIRFGESTNIFDEKITKVIEQVIEQIAPIFSLVVPGAKLIADREVVNIENEKTKEAINIYVERNNNKILLEQESTGIIKLVSLLSLIIHYVKDKDSIIAIDELDIHIFEYLLALLLEKLSLNAKGQLIFTAHNLLPMEKLNKDSIIISTTAEDNNVEYIYLKGVSDTTNLRNKYLKSQRMWSENNIEPLQINTSALELYIKKLMN